MGTRVEPRGAAAQSLHPQGTFLEVHAIQVRDLELPSRRGLQRSCERGCASVVEIDSGDRVIRRRPLGLLEKVGHLALRVELDHPVPLGILHVIAEYRGALGVRRGGLEELGEIRAVEDIVPENERRRRSVEKRLSNDQCLRNSIGLGLNRILEPDAPLLPIPQQLAERDLIPRRRDDQEFADAGRHQRRERIVDHRFVVYRQQLLALRQRDRVKSGAGAAGQNDPLACF